MSSSAILIGAEGEPQQLVSRGPRQYYWDLIRSVLLIAGIPIHAGLMYHPRKPWLIMSPDRDPVSAAMTDTLTTFRMPVFFLVAGYFSWMILRRRGSTRWLADRLRRLGLPLLTGILLINLFQIWLISASGAGDRATSFWSEASTPGDQWIRHLWFLQALIVYSAMLAVVFQLLQSNKLSDIDEVIDREVALRPVVSLIVLALIAGAYRIAVNGLFSVAYSRGYEMPLNGLIDPQRWLVHAIYFFFGALIMAKPQLLAAVTRFTPLVIIGPALAIIWPHINLPDRAIGQILSGIASGFIGVGMTNLLLWATVRWFNRDSRVIANIVDASFTIYLVHPPIVTVLGILFLRIDLPPLLEVVVICIICFALSYAIHRLIRHSPLALLALNGVRPAMRPTQAVVGPAVTERL